MFLPRTESRFQGGNFLLQRLQFLYDLGALGSTLDTQQPLMQLFTEHTNHSILTALLTSQDLQTFITLGVDKLTTICAINRSKFLTINQF